MICKPGDLLKKGKLLPMKARLHKRDVLLHAEREGRTFVLPYTEKSLCWQMVWMVSAFGKRKQIFWFMGLDKNT